MRRGFTIVELLMVIAIISVLSTIIIIATAGALKHARANRANAMRVALEQAVNAYYAQVGEWPKGIETKAENATEDICTFSAGETDEILREVVGKAFGKGSGPRSQLIDASALFVANAGRLGNGGKGCFDNHADRRAGNFCGDKRCVNGIDFTLAANRNGKGYVNFSSMAFGYAGPENGKFCRFWIEYNTKSDAVSVKLAE